jgi:hypothetical protein
VGQRETVGESQKENDDRGRERERVTKEVIAETLCFLFPPLFPFSRYLSLIHTHPSLSLIHIALTLCLLLMKARISFLHRALTKSDEKEVRMKEETRGMKALCLLYVSMCTREEEAEKEKEKEKEKGSHHQNLH